MNPVKTFISLARLAAAVLPAVLAGCAALTPPFIAAAERGTEYRSVVYKTVGEDELRLHLFFPAGHQTSDRRPAIVFFHGGGWYGGSPEQFFPHCRYLAYRGMVAASAEYRVEGRHGTAPPAAMADGNSAIRWLRSRAGELGLDPEKLAAGGGSAGGHLAATAVMSSGFDDPGDDLEVSTVPQALVLYNPALDVNLLEGPEAFGGRAEEASPIYQVRPGLPPTIIFQGTEDRTVPYQAAAHFTNLMKKAGNECILVTFRGLGHGFFNYGEKGNRPFRQTLWATDRFLAEHGFLEGEPPFTPGPAPFDREPAGEQ
jgi:acetyl esterase